MALIKSKQTNYGIEASYWRVGYVSLDRITKYGSISLNLFFNKDAVDYIDSKTVIIETQEEYEQFFSAEALQNYRDIYHAAYEFVKSKDEYFKNANIDEAA